MLAGSRMMSFIVHADALALPGIDQLGHIESKKLHQSFYWQMRRFHLGRVDPNLPIGRRTDRAHHLKRNSNALLNCAFLPDLAAFRAQLQILERSVRFAEDVRAHGMSHARHAYADFTRIDLDDVRPIVVEIGWLTLLGRNEFPSNAVYAE